MLISNGVVVTADKVEQADIRVCGELVAEIAANLKPNPGEQVIDACDMLILPGGVDVHTHMDLLVGEARATDSFLTGTIAAACGGTTTIIDHMAFGPIGANLQHQVDVYHQLAGGQAVVDYGFHGVIDHVDDEIIAELARLAAEGIPSVKFYMTYDRRLSDAEIVSLLKRTKELGMLVCVHCEDHAMLTELRQSMVGAGHLSPKYHPLSRPAEAEEMAIKHLIKLSEEAGMAPIYVVHTSSALGLAAALRLPTTAEHGTPGLPEPILADAVFLETCPQYLLLDDSLYDLPDGQGLKYIMSPPLRKPQDQHALWAGIEAGYINIIATDHCPWNFATDKQKGKDNFTLCPNGAAGVELRLALMHTEAVIKRGFSLSRFVDLCCTAPARRFGLYPRKGTIAVGCDADIVIFDPKRAITVRRDILHENVDYTPYEGFELRGYPHITLSRGAMVMREGKFVGRQGHGRFLHRLGA